MALVVGIHGIGHTYRTAPQLETAWFDALQGGLHEAGGPRLSRESFGMVAYGALYRREGTRAATVPPLGPPNVEHDWEKSMLESWWSEAARLAALNREQGCHDSLGEEPTIQPPEFESRARTSILVQRALRQLSKVPVLRSVGA